MAAPKLFGPGYSTYVRSVRIALAEKQVDYALEEFDFIASGFPAGYEQRHPFKKVPAFEHDGFSLFETHACLRYVDEAFDGPALQPADVKARARMTQAIGVIDNYTYGPLITNVFIPRAVVPMMGGTPDEAAIEAALPAAEKALGVLDGFLGGAWLAGQDLSLADCHLAPIVSYFKQIPEGQRILGGLQGLSRWWERMGARESVSSTLPKLG